MRKTHVFDKVMDYIDENIKCNYPEVARGIYAVSGYVDWDFNKFLSIFTEEKITLSKYFRMRQLFFASKELVEFSDKSISEIAFDYGYAEQSSFSRALKREYGKTPNEIRKQRLKFKDNKLHFSDFEFGKRLKSSIDGIFGDGDFCAEPDYFDFFIEAIEKFGFDTATCYAVSEISERIGVPFGILLNACFETMIDVKSNDEYLDLRTEKSVCCGVTSDEELKKICEYYDCEYYQINEHMVNEYRKHCK